MEFLGLAGLGGLEKSEFKIISRAKVIEAQERCLNDKCLETWFGNISYEK